jgi:hypothetical protein
VLRYFDPSTLFHFDDGVCSGGEFLGVLPCLTCGEFWRMESPLSLTTSFLDSLFRMIEFHEFSNRAWLLVLVMLLVLEA